MSKYANKLKYVEMCSINQNLKHSGNPKTYFCRRIIQLSSFTTNMYIRTNLHLSMYTVSI